MAAVELDPQFVKALRLLRSKSKDSGAQLRAMLEDAIRQKKGLAPAPPRSPSIGKTNSRSVSSDRGGERSEKEKKKDLDRLKKDLSELVDKPTDPKRARLESPGRSSTSHSPSPPSISPPGETRESMEGGSGGSETEYGDLQMNLEFTDCSCCVCKTFTQESSNKLMECSSCQNLYHQECHSPAVSNQEASDPRLIWNCYKCTKKSSGSEKEREKGGSSSSSSKPRSEKGGSSSGSKGSSGSSSKRSSSSSSKHKSDSGHGSSKSSGSKSKSSSVSSSGLAAGSSGGSSSGASSGTELSSSAKKRLKLLKKQAAAATNISKKTKK